MAQYYPTWYDRRPADMAEVEKLLRRLADEAKPYLRITSQKLDAFDALTVEADELARAGDYMGAKHRLRLRDYPKWSSAAECEAEYRSHMAAQRAAASPEATP